MREYLLLSQSQYTCATILSNFTNNFILCLNQL